MRILEVNNVDTFYKASQALFGISISINDGEVVGLIGRNGAGKTTTLKTVMGIVPSRTGSIKFHGKEIKNEPIHKIAQMGVGFVPADRRIFPGLTVADNLKIVSKRGGSWTIQRVYEAFPDLGRFHNHLGDRLSGGLQQMLTIGRTLMTDPEVLLLDEPSEGLSVLVRRAVQGFIDVLRNEGKGILLAEANVKFALDVCNRIYILEKGQIRSEESSVLLRDNPEILTRYVTV